MKIKTLIIDDEPIALTKLRKYVERLSFLELVGTCSSAPEAFALMQSTPVDVIFTDINMPDLDGLSFISTLSNPPMVVFITAHAQYAVDSYRLSAVDYLLKPYGFADFQRAAAKVMQQYALTHRELPAPADSLPDYIFVKTDSRFLKVRHADILYIKGYGEYLQIFLIGQSTPLVTLSSFASIQRHLPPGFMQVHRSFLVNLDRVESVERMRIVMENDEYIPVSDTYKNDFQNYLRSRSVGMK